MIEVLKQAYQLLLTEPHAPTVCDQLEVIFRQAIAELESQEPDVQETLHWHAFNYRQADTAQAHEMWLKLEQFVDRKMKAPQRTEQEPVAKHEALIERLEKTCLGLDAVDPLRLLVGDIVLALKKSPQRTEQNFCSRCGKRTADLTTIHTCTPPQD